ncbi:hypothetical protein BDW62DRAFT_204085 [Aspergillus aurantiobrunneus]
MPMPLLTQRTAKIVPIIPQTLSSESLSNIVAKYKTLRLTALQSNPEAFTSTYAREAQFSDGAWTSRVLNPLGRIFVALLHGPGPQGFGSDGDESLVTEPWLGQLTLLGPVLFPPDDENATRAPWELFKNIDFAHAASAALSIPAGSRVVYVLLGMYVLPEGRGVGNGRNLVEAAIGAVDEERSEKGVSATVAVLVARENVQARRLYERVGFVAGHEAVDIEGCEHWALLLEIE